jgi:hypothetical protein
MKRLALLSMLVVAAPAAGQLQAPFTNLQCVGVGGEVASWEGFGAVTTAPPDDDQSFIIGAVDITRGTALFTDDSGSFEVRAIPLEDTMTFLQIGFSGDQAFTTVFYRTREDNFYFFVHSRHTSVAGAPVVSQTHGFCASVV